MSAPPTSRPERWAWVTGAGGVLGSALAAALEESGWGVVRSVRPESIIREPTLVGRIGIDVTEPRSVGLGWEKIAGMAGPLDLLICCAGCAIDAPLWQISEAAWDRVVNTNLRGAFYCARAVLPEMVRRKRGCILFVGSYSGRVGSRGQSSYSASKAGLIGLAKSLAEEVGPPELGNVRVNVVLPGVLESGITRHLSAARREAYTRANALRRWNDPSQVARLVVQVAESEFISGQVLQMDSRIAGWT